MAPLESKRFSRRAEDFSCARCGAEVTGDGYTDHCPRCLWSRHVDRTPGDRRADCGGMMRPVGVESGRKGWVIRYRCERCGYEHRNRAAPDDDYEAVLALARERSTGVVGDASRVVR